MPTLTASYFPTDIPAGLWKSPPRSEKSHIYAKGRRNQTRFLNFSRKPVKCWNVTVIVWTQGLLFPELLMWQVLRENSQPRGPNTRKHFKHMLKSTWHKNVGTLLWYSHVETTVLPLPICATKGTDTSWPWQPSRVWGQGSLTLWKQELSSSAPPQGEFPVIHRKNSSTTQMAMAISLTWHPCHQRALVHIQCSTSWCIHHLFPSVIINLLLLPLCLNWEKQ